MRQRDAPAQDAKITSLNFAHNLMNYGKLLLSNHLEISRERLEFSFTCFFFVYFQNRVSCREDAYELVRLPPSQIPQG